MPAAGYQAVIKALGLAPNSSIAELVKLCGASTSSVTHHLNRARRAGHVVESTDQTERPTAGKLPARFVLKVSVEDALSEEVDDRPGRIMADLRAKGKVTTTGLVNRLGLNRAAAQRILDEFFVKGQVLIRDEGDRVIYTLADPSSQADNLSSPDVSELVIKGRDLEILRAVAAVGQGWLGRDLRQSVGIDPAIFAKYTARLEFLGLIEGRFGDRGEGKRWTATSAGRDYLAASDARSRNYLSLLRALREGYRTVEAIAAHLIIDPPTVSLLLQQGANAGDIHAPGEREADSRYSISRSGEVALAEAAASSTDRAFDSPQRSEPDTVGSVSTKRSSRASGGERPPPSPRLGSTA